MWGFKQPSYTTKRGFITTPLDVLRGATLFIYNNGLTIVEDDLYGRKYEVEKIDDTAYKIVTKSVDKYEKFLVAE